MGQRPRTSTPAGTWTIREEHCEHDQSRKAEVQGGCSTELIPKTWDQCMKPTSCLELRRCAALAFNSSSGPSACHRARSREGGRASSEPGVLVNALVPDPPPLPTYLIRSRPSASTKGEHPSDSLDSRQWLNNAAAVTRQRGTQGLALKRGNGRTGEKTRKQLIERSAPASSLLDPPASKEKSGSRGLSGVSPE